MPKAKVIVRHVLRRRDAWSGWWPRSDTSGKWRQVRWLFWRWDKIGEPVGSVLAKQVDDMRGSR